MKKPMLEERRALRAWPLAGKRSRAGARGLSLLEVLIATGVLTIIATMVYGAMSTLSRGRTNANRLSERYRLARLATTRMSHELSEAYLSLHMAALPALITRNTAFIGTDRRVDFNAFAHRRIVKDAHESDQCEISYFVANDPKGNGQLDLARREQVIIDEIPGKGGVSQIILDDIDSFTLKYLDPMSGLWTESWDSTSGAAQLGRMPLQVEINLVFRHGPAGADVRLRTKTDLMIPMPLSFALK